MVVKNDRKDLKSIRADTESGQNKSKIEQRHKITNGPGIKIPAMRGPMTEGTSTTSILILIAFLFCISIFLLFIYYPFLHPRRIMARFHKIPDFAIDKHHFSALSGIAFDFTQRIAVYSNGFRANFMLSASEITYCELEWVNVFENGSRREIKHEVRILTTREDCPEIKMAFWLRDNALRCKISIDKMLQAQNAFEREHTPSDIALTAFLKARGFSRSDADEDVRNGRLREALELLHRENEKRPKANKWTNATLINALKPIFLRREDEAGDIGYTENTMSKMVSKILKDIRESDKNRIKSKGKK